MSDEFEHDPFDDLEDDEEEATSPAAPRGAGASLLGKWYVLYPLCAAVLVGALYLGLRLRDGLAGPIPVTFDTEPEDVTVLEEDEELVPADDGTYRLAPGKHELTFRKDGYKSRTVEYVVSAKENRFEVELKRLSEESLLVELVPPDAELRVDGVVRAAPNGRTELRAPQGEDLVLQVSHPDYHSFRESYSAEQLEASDYRLRVELEPLEGETGVPGRFSIRQGGEKDPETGHPTRLFMDITRGGPPLELVLIKPGQFDAGVTTADLYDGELSPRRVRIERPFYIGATEITNEQYAEFARAVGTEQAGTQWKDFWEQQDRAERLPVVGVSVTQAEAFCAWLGGRLPTEEEWEYAARGPNGGRVARPWGPDPLDATRANLLFDLDEPQRLLPVNSLPNGSTPSGLLHMLGNVAEWTGDAYRAGFGEDEASPDLAGKNAIRGCSFMKSADAEARLTWRAPEGPEGTADVGIRIVCNAGD